MRNQIEIDSCVYFVKDYIKIQREVTQLKREQNRKEASKSVGMADPSELKQAREEIDKLRAHISKQALGQATV